MKSPAKPKVSFFFKTTTSLSDRTKLKKFIERAFRNEKKRLRSLNFIFCTDKELLSINRQYLNHDFYTDIITFDLSENENSVEGEIYISVDRVKENSRVLIQSIDKELHRVIFHGVLHLCGFKDKTRKDIIMMRKKEDELLQRYFM